MPSRRTFLAATAIAATFPSMSVASREEESPGIDEQLLEIAREQEAARRRRFASLKTRGEAEQLQRELRDTFLSLLDGLPKAESPPAARIIDRIKGDGYTIDKIVYQSLPDYHVPALLYLPAKIDRQIPGIISPCGHSETGKAADSYQILHIHLAKRGYAVLTYDPVGQGERSQYWDAARKRSRYNLTCGEHAVLGNPLYLLGTSLARYRIWDGLRAIDYLTSLPQIDGARIGCAGNSGGGTLSAYISALDARVKAAVISCYITTLPRRMANRIEADPDADPEQDIFGFVSGGIDHAGLLAMRAPRPTLVCSAQFDFFPIEGAKESCDEAKAFFAKFNASDRISQAVAPFKHGLSLPLREATYAFFDQWLGDKPHADAPTEKEMAVKIRPASELLVCPEGQVNVTYRSRHLLSIAADDFRRSPRPKRALESLFAAEGVEGRPVITPIRGGKGKALLLLIEGNEARAWSEEKEFQGAIATLDFPTSIVCPRGVGPSRPKREVKGQDYGDPLCGVEENLAYNAFLVGRSLLAMRVNDVRKAVAQVRERQGNQPIVVVAREDAALVAAFAAALEPAITHLALEGMLMSYWSLFSPESGPINAAGILPRMLRDYGDLPDLFAELKGRSMLLAAPRGKVGEPIKGARIAAENLTERPKVLVEWLKEI